MKYTVLKWLLLILLMGYTVWVTIWANREADLHKCTGITVNVSGTDNTNILSSVKNGIIEEIAKYPDKIVGVPVHQVDTRKIENYLSRISNFESVNCMINSDNNLFIEARPLEPVMRVFDGSKSYYINKEGKRIEAKAEFFTDVPVVCGSFNKNFPARDVIPLIRYIGTEPKLANLVSMVVARDSHNLMLVPRIKGHVINFGDTSRLEEKTRNLFLFYRKVMPYKGWGEYDTISVKFRGQVVATRTDKAVVSHGEQEEEDIDPEEHTLPEVGATEPQD